MANAIDIQQLHYTYNKGRQIFKDFSLEVPAGKRFGLFGPNGAGKTTLMSLITGLLTADSGSIKIFGNDFNKDREVKKQFGFVPQDFSFYHELSTVENLQFFGAWYGMSKESITKNASELIDILKLNEVKHKPVKRFSGGMKRKVNLAIGMLHQPSLLILDEPTVGVDIQTRHDIVQYLKRLNEKGTTLLYTSHQLDEAGELCNHIALINEGEIIANDELDNLLNNYKQDNLEQLFLSLTQKEKVATL